VLVRNLEHLLLLLGRHLGGLLQILALAELGCKLHSIVSFASVCHCLVLLEMGPVVHQLEGRSIGPDGVNVVSRGVGRDRLVVTQRHELSERLMGVRLVLLEGLLFH
jgi:hypothetical protein